LDFEMEEHLWENWKDLNTACCLVNSVVPISIS
jgi:hypothetical protein